MLPYTLILLMACYVTMAYSLPATATPASILSVATPAIAPRLDPEDLDAAPVNLKDDSPTTTIMASSANIAPRQQSIPPYTPIVTPAPDQDAQLASLGYYQTTYYACNTIDGKERCGWHIPVMKAGARKIGEKTEVVVGLIAGLVIFWILL